MPGNVHQTKGKKRDNWISLLYILVHFCGLVCTQNITIQNSICSIMKFIIAYDRRSTFQINIGIFFCSFDVCWISFQFRSMIREQGCHSGECARLPTMWRVRIQNSICSIMKFIIAYDRRSTFQINIGIFFCSFDVCWISFQFRSMIREQGCHSGECARLPTMWRVRFPDPGLSFFLASLLCFERFSPGTPVFASPQKPTFPNSNSILEYTDISERVLVNSLVLRR